MRAQQKTGDRGLERPGIRKPCQSFAERAIAGLVVILQEIDKGAGRKIVAALTAQRAPPVKRRLALVDEAFRQPARQLFRGPLRIVAVIAAGFIRQKHMEGMMDIIVPLRVEAMAQMACGVVLIFQSQMNVTAIRFPAQFLRQPVQPPFILDDVDGIEPQSVEAKSEQPITRILAEEIAHFGDSEIDRWSPGRRSVDTEEGLRVKGEIISLRPEM